MDVRDSTTYVLWRSTCFRDVRVMAMYVIRDNTSGDGEFGTTHGERWIPSTQNTLDSDEEDHLGLVFQALE